MHHSHEHAADAWLDWPDNGTDILPHQINAQAAEPDTRVFVLIDEDSNDSSNDMGSNSSTSGGRVDGLICCQRRGRGMFVWGVRVREAAQRRGHALRLLAAAEAHARRTPGVEALLSTTIAANTAMSQAFPRLGYLLVRQLHLWPAWSVALDLHERRRSGAAPPDATLLSLLPGARAAVSSPEADALLPHWRRCGGTDELHAALMQLRRHRQSAGAEGSSSPGCAPSALHDWLPGEYAVHAACSPAVEQSVRRGDVWLLLLRELPELGAPAQERSPLHVARAAHAAAAEAAAAERHGAALIINRRDGYRGIPYAGIVASSAPALAVAVRQAAKIEPGVLKLYVDAPVDPSAFPLFAAGGGGAGGAPGGGAGSVADGGAHDCLVFAKPLLPPHPRCPPRSRSSLPARVANTTAAIAPVAADLAAAYLSGGANASSATRVVGDALAEPGECFLGTGALATALKATAACANATALADFLRATTSPTPPALNTSLNATGPPPTQQQIIDTANNGSTSDIIALAQASVAAMVAGQTAQQVQTLAGALDATGCLTGPVANKILPAIYTTLIEKFNYDVFAASVVCPGSRGFFINK
eukprot:scaffold6.g2659.t1